MDILLMMQVVGESPEGKHCAPPGFTSCLLALMALHILQRCPISFNTSKSGSSMTLPFKERSTSCQQHPDCRWDQSAVWVEGGGTMRGGTHHVSNDVVVPALRSVHPQDAKHDENHGAGVHQGAHCRAAAHAATAGVEAKRLGRLSVGRR